MAAAPRDNHAPNFCPATETGFALALVNAVPLLKFTAIPLRVNIIGNRGTSKTDGGFKNFPDGAV